MDEITKIVAALGWPQITLIVSLVFIVMFRKKISELITRVTSIDRSGIKTAPAPEAQREERRSEAVQELLASIGETIVLLEVEARIRKELQDKGLDTSSDSVKVLVRHLAATQILLEFEQIHSLIFGSQIFLLKKLNEFIGQGRSSEYVENHFEHVKDMFSEQLGSWSFDQYMGFLRARALITQHGVVYHITNIGVEYLTWIVRSGRSDEKPL